MPFLGVIALAGIIINNSLYAGMINSQLENFPTFSSNDDDL
jgi:hypothetical protein